MAQPALAELTGNEKFASDAYRRFIKMFGDVVLKISSTENFQNMNVLCSSKSLSLK